MKTYHGYQFKRAVVIAIHKICSDLGLNPVEVRWDGGTQTACINKSGTVILANVKDDAVLTQGDLMRYVGMAVHELLHWMYTDFDAVRSAHVDEGQYVAQLHNALEDAWIEGKGIKAGLTGNIEELLSALINGMVAEGLAYKNRRGEPIDWSDPVQYPFVLAVYGRKHAKIKVPLALGLEPIFAEAIKRLNTCGNSWDTLNVAKWVFDQLNNLSTDPQPEDEPVQPPTNPTPPSDDEGEDEGEGGDGGEGDDETGSGGDSEQPTGGDQGGDAPTPKPDPAKPPTKDGETVEAREVEPTANPPEGAGSGGSYSTDDVMRKGYHTRADNPRTFPIDF